jgi:hypothetical protein
MAIAIGWFRSSKRKRCDMPSPKRAARTSIDPALKVVLDKRDDRLLRDAGLTRQGVLGEAAYFWSEWSRQRATSNL